jgi:4'-phosphopantetheinyl transferase
VTPTLSPGSLHVWCADLDRGPEVDLSALSPAELERADRFRFDRDRVRWTRCRAILRRLLAGYLSVAPNAIVFATGPNGKPCIAGERIAFNVSHAREVAAFALALDNPVGIDVELCGRLRDPLHVAGVVLGAQELERLISLPHECREKEFLGSWVRHEAALKCRGGRLGESATRSDLHLIDLDLEPAVASVALERAPDVVLVRELGPEQAGRRGFRVPA